MRVFASSSEGNMRRHRLLKGQSLVAAGKSLKNNHYDWQCIKYLMKYFEAPMDEKEFGA